MGKKPKRHRTYRRSEAQRPFGNMELDKVIGQTEQNPFAQKRALKDHTYSKRLMHSGDYGVPDLNKPGNLDDQERTFSLDVYQMRADMVDERIQPTPKVEDPRRGFVANNYLLHPKLDLSRKRIFMYDEETDVFILDIENTLKTCKVAGTHQEGRCAQLLQQEMGLNRLLLRDVVKYYPSLDSFLVDVFIK